MLQGKIKINRPRHISSMFLKIKQSNLVLILVLFLESKGP